MLYPNPSTGRLFMTGPPNGMFRLYASNGSLALESPVRKMDISVLPKGLYLARVTSADNCCCAHQRVVKE
ncbi:MAG: T9SS type A sorting domain-containing protein [Flavobacteriales bacterium]|nr:T9SS type A sorting domain-containing protein [Flavobacteriales bacterium]